MPVRTVNWVPPSLCGCELRITGNFTSEPVDGKHYQHPTPFSITGLEIVGVCSEHEQYAKAMPDVSRLYDTPAPDGIHGWLASQKGGQLPSKQHRGYLKHPISNPTPAECLYTHLSFHRGQKWTLECGCSTFQHFDHENKLAHRKHPVHSNQCEDHQGDDLEMTQAYADHKAYLAAMERKS
jgi:hypothetical protein